MNKDDLYRQLKPYNFQRAQKYLSIQRDEIFPISQVEFDEEVNNTLLEISKIDEDYVSKVIKLSLNLYSYSKCDTPVPNWRYYYSFKGLDIPEVTHRIGNFDNMEFETWSKDITWGHRFIYNIYSNSYIKIVSVFGHDNPNFYKEFSINEGDNGLKLFSNVGYNFIEERRQWIQEHAHMSKQSRDMIMPLHLKYPDLQPFSPQFKEASKVAEQKVLKHIRKEKLPEVQKLTPKLLYDNEIRGTLIERRIDREWKIMK